MIEAHPADSTGSAARQRIGKESAAQSIGCQRETCAIHSVARPLRILVSGSMGRRLIAPALPRLLTQYAGLQVHLVDRACGRFTQDWTAAVRFGPIPACEVVLQEIGGIRMVTCASPDFIDCRRAPRAPQDLAPGDCVGVIDAGKGIAQEWVFSRDGAKYVLLPCAPLAFSDADAAVAAAVRGAGYVRLPIIDVDQEIAAGLLQPVLEGWNEECCLVSITVPRDRYPHDVLHAFCDFVAGLVPGCAHEERLHVPQGTVQ